MTKISESSQSNARFRKNISEAIKGALLRYAIRYGILKPVQFAADNIWCITTKTVDARFHDGNFTIKDIEAFLRRTKDEEFAQYIKLEIDEWMK